MMLHAVDMNPMLGVFGERRSSYVEHASKLLLWAWLWLTETQLPAASHMHSQYYVYRMKPFVNCGIILKTVLA